LIAFFCFCFLSYRWRSKWEGGEKKGTRWGQAIARLASFGDFVFFFFVALDSVLGVWGGVGKSVVC
jgi:hypothetical protein